MCDVYEDIDLNKSVFVKKDPKHFVVQNHNDGTNAC